MNPIYCDSMIDVIIAQCLQRALNDTWGQSSKPSVYFLKMILELTRLAVLAKITFFSLSIPPQKVGKDFGIAMAKM